jgi:uncharacterized protein YbjT (DUF2867 family)
LHSYQSKQAGISKMYLVTGVTGNVGSEVVAQLLEGGEKVRVFTRDPAKVAHWGQRVEVAIGDFERPETFERAMENVEGVFLMNGGPDGESFQQLISAAKSRGSARIVFLSTLLANVPGFWIGELHKAKEDVIRESGLPGKFVRPGGFMTNAYQWLDSIRSEGVVYNAMGSGQSASIAPADVAAVVVKALQTPNLSEEVFELTGGELLSVPEQVRILSQVLGKPIRCVDVPTETAIQGLLRAGVPPQIAAAIGQGFDAVRDGRAARMTSTVERVTGHPPKTFERWAREHAARFVKAG